MSVYSFALIVCAAVCKFQWNTMFDSEIFEGVTLLVEAVYVAIAHTAM